MNYEIADVNSSAVLANDLVHYAKRCSFQGTGSYLAELLSDNVFEDYERVYVAVQNQEIIGFAAIVKESCVEYDHHSPWLDFLFVDEKYREKHIGLAFITKICAYAKSIGFTCLYLCTVSHVDYYKKAGFQTVYTTDFYNGARQTEMISIMKRRL